MYTYMYICRSERWVPYNHTSLFHIVVTTSDRWQIFTSINSSLQLFIQFDNTINNYVL